MTRWAVFISGRGSNLQALLDSVEENRIVLVVSSSAQASGLVKARRMGVPTVVLRKKIDWVQLDQELRKYSVNRIFLAGFMKLIPASFVNAWDGKVLNVHPSLLPAFPGLNAVSKSFESKAPMGVTVHVVTAEMDAGPIVLQKKAPRQSLTLTDAEFLISITEQAMVREAFRRWN